MKRIFDFGKIAYYDIGGIYEKRATDNSRSS